MTTYAQPNFDLELSRREPADMVSGLRADHPGDSLTPQQRAGVGYWADRAYHASQTTPDQEAIEHSRSLAQKIRYGATVLTIAGVATAAIYGITKLTPWPSGSGENVPTRTAPR